MTSPWAGVGTGGVLNDVNRRHKTNAPWKTIGIMKLVNAHRPRTEAGLEALIAAHTDTDCRICGQRARNGGLAGWSVALWSAVQRELADPRSPLPRTELLAVTPLQCAWWMHALYLRQPLKGCGWEARALAELEAAVGGFRAATAHEDEAFGVDLVHARCGVQVKPATYRGCAAAVQAGHAEQNRRFGRPVVYLYYDDPRREWLNWDTALAEIAQAGAGARATTNQLAAAATSSAANSMLAAALPRGGIGITPQFGSASSRS
jgi:hypothetical protein